MADALPVTDGEFADAMAALGLAPDQGPVAVAVSGGPDSMALAHLAARWGRVTGLIVDHGLRPGSGEEASLVARRLARAGISADILHWEGTKPARGLQAAARDARYRLLENACRARGIPHLLLAHHRDDQAETLLLRLARGSGVRGLAGMAARSGPVASPGEDFPVRLRPLLGVPKSRLIATCRALGIETIEDPSNRRTDFDRTAARQLLAAPPLPGLDAAGLAATAARLARASSALDHYVAAHLAKVTRFHPEGHASIDPGALADAPEEIALRVLSELLRSLGGQVYPPSLDAVESLMQRLGARDFGGATLAGCRLLARRRAEIVLCREYRKDIGTLALAHGESGVFDRRFRVRLAEGRPVVVGPLGHAGLAALADSGSDRESSHLPHAVRLVLPAAFRGGRPVAVPHIGYRADETALEIVGLSVSGR